MKILIYLILMGLFACENTRRPNEEFPPAGSDGNTWISYEGRVPLSEESHLYIELSMVSSNEIGDGFFRMEEFIEEQDLSTRMSSFQGKYSTFIGEKPDERIIQFHNSARSEAVKRTYKAPAFKGNITDSRLTMIREEPFRSTDLTVKIQGKDKLVVLSDRLETISGESEHNLIRRFSPLFTVEGYFRHNGDSADFFEINTGQTWAVSKYGDYRKAIRQYHQLTTKKFQVAYLKGIGFSIRHNNKEGQEIEALVIKKVLQMTSAPDPEQTDAP